jgi:hypothetical protein
LTWTANLVYSFGRALERSSRYAQYPLHTKYRSGGVRALGGRCDIAGPVRGDVELRCHHIRSASGIRDAAIVEAGIDSFGVAARAG